MPLCRAASPYQAKAPALFRLITTSRSSLKKRCDLFLKIHQSSLFSGVDRSISGSSSILLNLPPITLKVSRRFHLFPNLSQCEITYTSPAPAVDLLWRLGFTPRMFAQKNHANPVGGRGKSAFPSVFLRPCFLPRSQWQIISAYVRCVSCV